MLSQFRMTALQTIEKYLGGDYQISPCESESDYYALWAARGIGNLPPEASAIAGAMLADRLPWVFTAGYQATLRDAFPMLPRGGWAAFAATEDAVDPGATLTGANGASKLNGNKGWVAHSAVVDHLIVTVNDPMGDKRKARGLIVERDRGGVTLTHRAQPGFLGAMSQGFANFNDVQIEPNEVFEFEAIRQFGRSEAKFVMLAASAFMLAKSEEATELHDRLINTAAALVSLLAQEHTSRQVYASIDREFQRCVDLFEQQVAVDEIPDYGADRKMFRMYTDRIQRRRVYAKREVGSSK
ncbi:MAG: alkylation response protein AidB-like acyl-CoA dehydrogenase [Gammaproteobacteria bacterium]|jgi:alkylation response protein AidB-like acyl-CoA dehydrogenase